MAETPSPSPSREMPLKSLSFWPAFDQEASLLQAMGPIRPICPIVPTSRGFTSLAISETPRLPGIMAARNCLPISLPQADPPESARSRLEFRPALRREDAFRRGKQRVAAVALPFRL